ncbi:hypothetical protein VTK73DRAFT_4074 [Phialemonium thermophilum]|uniref:Uncharacterized protein n=1 Tax=Phialemonium thermophilum TaxID=223376 RepID=A0ABR3VD18_9PEZI
MPRKRRKSSMMSMMAVIWKNMRTRWPVALYLGRMRSSSSNLPAVRHSESLLVLVGFIWFSTSSKTKGWLQSLRSCMIMLLRPRAPVLPPLPSLTAIFWWVTICLYRRDCRAENLHLMTFSVLSGRSFSTSFLRRRSRKGRSTLCRRRMTRICSSSVSSILSWPPVLAKGVLNHSSKVLADLKMLGRTKLSMAHSSARLFCSGVPVRIRRKRVL